MENLHEKASVEAHHDDNNDNCLRGLRWIAFVAPAWMGPK
jgi:hypothetical protein